MKSFHQYTELHSVTPDDLRMIPEGRVVPPSETPPQATKTERRWFSGLHALRDKYNQFKKGLIERTNETLATVATEYVERYEAARNSETGEVPNSLLRRLSNGVEAVRHSVSLRSSFDLICRGALQPLEFATKMTFTQFGVDLAIRQADYQQTREQYQQKGLSEQAIELQALTFAQEVHEQFSRLQALQKELPIEKDVQQQKRQEHVAAGVDYAQELLAKIDWIDPVARERIIQEVKTYVDVTVFGPDTKTWGKWLKLGQDYKKQLHKIVTSNVDLYQKKRARNVSVFSSAARWLTFGAETILIQNACSAYSSINKNYDKVLQAVPASERAEASRLALFGQAVKESLVQFSGWDRYRALRAETAGVDQFLDSLTNVEMISRTQLKVDLFAKYDESLRARGLDQAWLDGQIDALSYNDKQERVELAHFVRHRLAKMQEKYIKATAAHTEHLYQKYVTTVATVGVAASVDALIEDRFGIREAVSTELSAVSQGNMEIERPTFTTTAIHDTLDYDPHVEVTDAVLEPIDRYLQKRVDAVSTHQDVDTQAASVNAAEYWATEAEDLVEEELATTAMMSYTVQRGDSLWKIAQQHLEVYRIRKDNSKVNINDVMRFIKADNNLADNHVFHPGDKLQLPSFNTVEAASPHFFTETQGEASFDLEYYRRAVHQVEAGHPPKDYIPGMSRESLHTLPHGTYAIVLGERYSRGLSTPEHYSDVAVIKHTAEDMTIQTDQFTDALTLQEFLKAYKHPIMRVFQIEGERRELQPEHLQPEQWSQRTHALIHSLQTDPLTVLDNNEAQCSKHIGRMFNKLDDQLGEFVGIQSQDAQGRSTGMTVPAPMLAEAMLARGGNELVSLEGYFARGDQGVYATETLASTNPEYRAAVHNWIQQAAKSPLEVVTALYDFTKIKHIIASNATIGGEPNSHGMLTLGREAVSSEVTHDTTVSSWLHEQYRITPKLLQLHGWMFEGLGIDLVRADGTSERITDQKDWSQLKLAVGDQMVIHDVMVNHRYHMSLQHLNPRQVDRSDLLITSLLVSEGFLKPVSVIEPNATLLNEALVDKEHDSTLLVQDFHALKVGETLGSALRAVDYPPDLYTAIQFVWEQEDHLRLDRIRPGTMIPIYDPEIIRERLSDIYERQEQRLAQAEQNPRIHIVRPGEGMDTILSHYGYERSLYSASEWNFIKERVAERLREDTDGKIAVAEVTVGKNQTPTLEYRIAANTVLRLNDQQFFDDLEWELFEQHRAERVFIPDTLPIRTEDGVVETAFPSEIRARIDWVMNRNPEYSEEVRAALALVYANEGLRETAGHDTWVGEQLSYLTSRRLLKDIAWGFKDLVADDRALRTILADIKKTSLIEMQHPMNEGSGLMYVLAAAGEKALQVSSAGDFQVRASNFIQDRDSAAYANFEQALRDDPGFNIEMAAKLLHMNLEVLKLHGEAFGDPLLQQSESRILAVVGSYNGGMSKVLLGGWQDSLITLANVTGISVEDSFMGKATGRGTAETRAALVDMCKQLTAQGLLTVDQATIARDITLLGSDTIHFWQTPTVRALQHIYQEQTGEAMSILPQESKLQNAQSVHSNYALLISQAMQRIESYSVEQRPRLMESEEVPTEIIGNFLAQRSLSTVGDSM